MSVHQGSDIARAITRRPTSAAIRAATRLLSPVIHLRSDAKRRELAQHTGGIRLQRIGEAQNADEDESPLIIAGNGPGARERPICNAETPQTVVGGCFVARLDRRPHGIERLPRARCVLRRVARIEHIGDGSLH